MDVCTYIIVDCEYNESLYYMNMHAKIIKILKKLK